MSFAPAFYAKSSKKPLSSLKAKVAVGPRFSGRPSPVVERERYPFSFFLFSHLLSILLAEVFSSPKIKKTKSWVLRAKRVDGEGRVDIEFSHEIKAKSPKSMTRKFKHRRRKLLGQGALGKVFKKGSKIKKIFLPNPAGDSLKDLEYFSKNFLREFLIGVVTYGQPDTFYRLAIGYIAGAYSARMTLPYLGPQSLEFRVKDLQEKGLMCSRREGFKYLGQACRQVADLHEKDIAHLDLKPDNMIVDEEGNLRIADFGAGLFFMEFQLLACQKIKKTTPTFKPGEAFSKSGIQYHGFSTDVYSLAISFLCTQGFSEKKLFDLSRVDIDSVVKKQNIQKFFVSFLYDYLELSVGADRRTGGELQALKIELLCIFKKMTEFHEDDRLSSRFLPELSAYFLALSESRPIFLSPALCSEVGIASRDFSVVVSPIRDLLGRSSFSPRAYRPAGDEDVSDCESSE